MVTTSTSSYHTSILRSAAARDRVPVRRCFFPSRFSPYVRQDQSSTYAITTTLATATSMTEARPDVMAPMNGNSSLLRINILFFNRFVPCVCWPSVGGCTCRTLSPVCLPSNGSCGWERNYCAEPRPTTIRFDFELALEFVEPLAHSRQADPRFCAILRSWANRSAGMPRPKSRISRIAASASWRKRTLTRFAAEWRCTFVKLSCNTRKSAVSILREAAHPQPRGPKSR